MHQVGPDSPVDRVQRPHRVEFRKWIDTPTGQSPVVPDDPGVANFILATIGSSNGVHVVSAFNQPLCEIHSEVQNVPAGI